MDTNRFLRRLFSGWRNNQRYHTAGTQALALISPMMIALFLLTGWQSVFGSLLFLVFVVVVFSVFVQSRMVVERPQHRVLREMLKVFDIILGIIVAVGIVFLAGSFTNMVILYLTYVTGAVLTSELHGRRFIQFGS